MVHSIDCRSENSEFTSGIASSSSAPRSVQILRDLTTFIRRATIAPTGKWCLAFTANRKRPTPGVLRTDGSAEQIPRQAFEHFVLTLSRHSIDVSETGARR